MLTADGDAGDTPTMIFHTEHYAFMLFRAIFPCFLEHACPETYVNLKRVDKRGSARPLRSGYGCAPR